MIDFISFYSKIAKIKTEKVLKKQYPIAMSKLDTVSKKINMVKKTGSALQPCDIDKVEEGTITYTLRIKKEPKKIGLVRHLRNAIAHWNIEEHPTNKHAIIIRDFTYDKRKSRLACYGVLDYPTLIELLDIGQ